MSEPTCPGCAQRDALIEALRKRVDELERLVKDLQARLGANASNSSLPPSANPPAAPPAVVKKPTGRKTGGQPGHKGHQRLRLPPERVQHVIALVPTHCEACRSPLSAQRGESDPEPAWHQFAELPRAQAVVTEFQGHARTCCCGHVTREAIPQEVRAHAFGPRLAAVLGYLQGSHHLSHRGLEEVSEVVFGVPLSLGSVSALREQLGEALAPAHQEIADEVRPAPAKNVDETGWKQAGQKRWLWAAVTGTAALFVIHLRRGAEGLKALLGETIQGLICSDRWSAYHSVPLERRQLCWAHLRRDFQAMTDRGGEAAGIGEELLSHADMMFGLWHKVRDGTRTRRWLNRHVDGWLRAEVRSLLEQGAACGCAKAAGACAEILKLEEALWTFARQEGLEPTDNAAERALRPAVIKRKRSFGCHSEEGCRFVERLLSVTQTPRLQGRPVLDYLVEALVAHRHGLPAPQLLATQ
jgi:transposase